MDGATTEQRQARPLAACTRSIGANPTDDAGASGRPRTRAVARFAWGLLAYDIAVVGWGAYVRATGSGAGCGRHWPTCNGELIPRLPSVETLVELSHRASSGAALVMTAALFLWTLKDFPRRHPARRAAAVAAGFMVSEALIGAGLVLFSLVGGDASTKRALGICLHLVNTFFLLAATALAAWWASGGAPVRLRERGVLVPLLAVPLAALVIVGATGAVTALGDTLFPSSTLAAGIARDFAPRTNLLLRVRVLHPLAAAFAAAVTVVSAGLVRNLRPSPSVRVLSHAAVVAVLAQVAAGILDLVSRAPVAMQLVHVMLADLVWIALVLTAAAALADDGADESSRASRDLPSASGLAARPEGA